MDSSSPATVGIEQQLRDIALRLEEIAAQAPEMSGMDLAHDRGNVSHEEWEAANAASKASVEHEQAELARIDELRARYPAEIDVHVDVLLAQLAQQLAAASARLASIADPEAERALRFRHSLLPDVIATLTSWRAQTPARYSYAWAWRSVYRSTDECAELLR